MQDFLYFEDPFYDNRSEEEINCLSDTNIVIIILLSEKLVFLNSDNEVLLITPNKV